MDRFRSTHPDPRPDFTAKPGQSSPQSSPQSPPQSLPGVPGLGASSACAGGVATAAYSAEAALASVESAACLGTETLWVWRTGEGVVSSMWIWMVGLRTGDTTGDPIPGVFASTVARALLLGSATCCGGPAIVMAWPSKYMNLSASCSSFGSVLIVVFRSSVLVLCSVSQHPTPRVEILYPSVPSRPRCSLVPGQIPLSWQETGRLMSMCGPTCDSRFRRSLNVSRTSFCT